MRFREFKLTEDELLEVKMSPTNLAKMVKDIGATVGIEFEMYIPNVESDDEDDQPDPEMDMDADESFPTGGNWRREVVYFFTHGDNPNTTTAVNRAISHLDEQFEDWYQEEFNEYLESIDGYDRQMEIAADNVVRDNYDDEDEYDEAVKEYFNDNISDIQEEIREEFDELRDEKFEIFCENNFESMWDFMQAFDLDWPYYIFPERERGYGLSIGEVADEFGNYMNRPVRAGSYHSGSQSQTNNYRVEYDASLENPDDDDDSGLEFISPRLSVEEALKDLDKVVKWAKSVNAYTKLGEADGTGGTGLHINVSVPGISAGTLDYVKLALFLGDDYIIDQFGREGNRYARGVLQKIKRQAIQEPERLETMLAKMQGQLNNIASFIVHTGRTEKYVTINTHTDADNFYIEFRAPGGDWLDSYTSNPNIIKNTLLRMVAATNIATKPELYREEYMKKLYKVLKPTEWAKSEPNVPDREIDNKWNNDAIKVFSRFSSGMLPKSVLKSFIRDIQKKRGEKKAATSDPDVTTNIPSHDQEFTGIWEIVTRNTNEVVYTISGIGNAVADAERYARQWQENTGFDDPVYVRPLMRPRDNLPRNQGEPIQARVGEPVPAGAVGGEQSSDANYEIYSNVSGQPVFRFIANTDEEARRKFQDWVSANAPQTGSPAGFGWRRIEGRGIPGSTAELARQRSQQQFTVDYTMSRDGETRNNRLVVNGVNADAVMSQIRSHLEQSGYRVDRIEVEPVVPLAWRDQLRNHVANTSGQGQR